MAFSQDRVGHTAFSAQQPSVHELSLGSLMEMEFPSMYNNPMLRERDDYQNRTSGYWTHDFDYQNRPMRAKQNFKDSHLGNLRYQHRSGNLGRNFPKGSMESKHSKNYKIDNDSHGRNMQNEQHKDSIPSSGFWRTDGFGLKEESFELIKKFLQGSEKKEPTGDKEAKKDLSGYVKNITSRIEKDRMKVEMHKKKLQQQGNGEQQTYSPQNDDLAVQTYESKTGASQFLPEMISEPSTSWGFEANTHQSLSHLSSSAPPPFPNIFKEFSSRSDSHELPVWDRVASRLHELETREGGILSLRHRSPDIGLESQSRKRMDIERRKSSRRSRSRSPRRARNRYCSRSPQRRERFSPRRLRSPSPWRRIPSPRGQRSPSPSMFRSTSPKGLRSPYSRELLSPFSRRLRSPSPLGPGNLSPSQHYQLQRGNGMSPSMSPSRYHNRSPEPYRSRSRSPYPSLNTSQHYSLQRGNGMSPSMSPSRYHNRSPEPYRSRSFSPQQEDSSLFTPLTKALKLLISAVKKSLTNYKVTIIGETFGGPILRMPPLKKKELLLDFFELRFSKVLHDSDISNNAQRSLTDLLDIVMSFDLDHAVIVEVNANNDVIDIIDTKPYELAEYIREADFTVQFKLRPKKGKRRKAKTKKAKIGPSLTKTRSGVPDVFSRLGVKIGNSEESSRPDDSQIHNQTSGSVFNRLGKKEDHKYS